MGDSTRVSLQRGDLRENSGRTRAQFTGSRGWGTVSEITGVSAPRHVLPPHGLLGPSVAFAAGRIEKVNLSLFLDRRRCLWESVSVYLMVLCPPHTRWPRRVWKDRLSPAGCLPDPGSGQPSAVGRLWAGPRTGLAFPFPFGLLHAQAEGFC